MKTKLMFSIILLIINISFSYSQQLSIVPNKENVVATHILGSWIPAEELNINLNNNKPGIPEIEFFADSTVIEDIPEQYYRFLSKNDIYLAGYFTFKEKTFPYVLTTLHGNPHIVFFERDEDMNYVDAESFNVMMVVADNTENDLLFIGGDFNNQPFAAFKRK